MAQLLTTFTIHPLSKPPTFFADAKSGFFLVEGSGQHVYWKDCYVLVFRTGETKTPLEKHPACDGEGLLPRGLDAFFGGPNGRFKEVAQEKVVADQIVDGGEYAEAEEKTKVEPEGGEKTGEKEEVVVEEEGPEALRSEKRRVTCGACGGKGYVEEP